MLNNLTIDTLKNMESIIVDLMEEIGDEVTLPEAHIMLVDMLMTKGHYVYEEDAPALNELPQEIQNLILDM
jgi:hypothetical protein